MPETVANRKPLRLHEKLMAAARALGIREGMIISAAMVFAGSLDYLVHIVVGRRLAPIEYGIFVSVTALVQVLIFLSSTIRSVVGFYTTEAVHQPESGQSVAALVCQAWRWAWRWGLISTAILLICIPLLTRQLRLPDFAPMWAASLMVLLLFLRQVTHGVLQGTQQFGGLGLVQVVQAALRLIFAVTFIWVGTRAVGALAAQTLSCALAVAVAVWWLRDYFRNTSSAWTPSISRAYPLHTFLGLTAFGILTNLDPLFVKHFYSPSIAGNYGPVATLAKISLFLPWSLGFVILPKVKSRLARGEETRPILLMGIVASLVPGFCLSAAYLMFPGALVKAVFGSAYTNPGIVLGLANIATTLYAGLYIWLNYALSLDHPSFIYGLVTVVVAQCIAMYAFGRQSLVNLMVMMIVAAALGHLVGFLTTWSPARSTATRRPELVPSEQ